MTLDRPRLLNRPEDCRLPELTLCSDGVLRFAATCQAATNEYVRPTDSVRVTAAAWRILSAYPSAAMEFAPMLWQVAQRTLDVSYWGPSVLVRNRRPAPRDRAVQALDLLLQLYSRPSLSLEIVARYLHLSPAYLCTVLKRASGYGSSTHLSGLRLLAAIRMLGNTDEDIQRIARRCGYAQPAVMNHDFRHLLHATPTQFRRFLPAPSENRTQS